MYRWIIICLMMVVGVMGNVVAEDGADKEPSQEDLKALSNTYGNLFGRSVKSLEIDINIDAFMQGFKDGLEGKPAPLSDQEFQQKMILLQAKAAQALAEKNLQEADSFMKDNASKAGINELQPGKLQYSIVEDGEGPTVEEHASPEINYTGKYIDGTVFGSSEDAGGPITLSLDQTIPGFSQGLVGMKEGERRRLFIHPDLGYGTSGHLPPNALLIFDIEVVKASTPTASDSADSDEDLIEENE